MIEEAAMRLYRARLAREKTATELREFREQKGSCPHENRDQDEYPCYSPYSRLLFDEWCDICKESQPLYIAKRHTAVMAGTALRLLMKECAKQEKPT